MPRIAGVDIPAKKRIVVALTYVYGIGPATSKKILKEARIDEKVRAEKLTEGEVAQIREAIEKSCRVEGDLRREVQENIRLLKSMGTYRGQRHIRRLPVRGQRSKTNARTCKGRPKVAIAGRKKVAAPK